MARRVKPRQRGMFEILAALLGTCNERTKRTHVLYRANLSTAGFRDYLQIALRSGLVQENEEDRSLRITSKGRLFLRYYHTIEPALPDGSMEMAERTVNSPPSLGE